jgi:hypothetical protein
MLCCFGGGGAGAVGRTVRCHVVVSAQLADAGGRSTTPRGSAAPLHAVCEVGGAPTAARPFTPPTSFPGLSTAVANELKQQSGAARAVCQKLAVAPDATGPHACSIALVVDLTFATTGSADAWEARLELPVVEAVEDGVAAAVTDAAPAGLHAVLQCSVSLGGGTRREENSTRPRRPSTLALRVSANSSGIEAELAAAPPNTFAPAPPPPDHA